MENFFGTLKSECSELNRLSDLNELRKALEDYIHYYNNERMSLKLKGLSPVEYRIQAQRVAHYGLFNFMESVQYEPLSS